MEDEIWKVKGEGEPVLEVWEDFYGDLWFVIDKVGDMEFGYARLYSMPESAEWGYFSIEQIKKEVGKYKVWQVKKINWENIDTYEEGLLVKCG